MNTAELWTTIILGGAITFALRWSFIALAGVITLPRRVQDALQYVPAAVLAAIIAPGVLIQNQQLDISANNLRLWAAVIAALVAWRTRSILYTLVVGMAALWALNALSAWLG